ncbi:MAG: universal stress protein [Desulfobacterales bacterium]|jgi:nucleotide-binding universal stress UspA family protein
MPFELQHIACAVDFSDHTKGVLRWGRFLARSFDARLSVFHAVTASHDRFPDTAIFERGGRQSDLLAAARQRLEEIVAPLENAKSIAVAGDPVAALGDYARKTSVDLVVAARHGFSGIQRVLLGSVVERMGRELATALLVVNMNAAGDTVSYPFRKVVVALEADDAHAPAFEVAVVMARCFDADLYLVSAMERPLLADELEPIEGPYREIQTALQQRLQQKMADMTSPLAGDLNVTVDLVPGPAVEVLPSYVRRRQADLLIVGVKSRRRFQQWLIGSTTEAALRHAACAVLTVPTTMN